VNLSGLDTAELRRGDLLTAPGLLQTTSLVDAHYRHLAGAAPLKHDAEVKLFVGAAEVMARARVLSHDALPAGQQGWLQLALAEPLALAKGDRFILRRPSPGATLGGGLVVDPHPARRHRRAEARLLARLETARKGTPAELLAQALDALGPATLASAIVSAGLDERAAKSAIGELEAAGGLVRLEPGATTPINGHDWVVTPAVWNRLAEEIRAALEAYHAAQPLRAGMPREELKSRLRLPGRAFAAVLSRAAALGLVMEAGPALRLPSHSVRFDSAQQARVDALIAQCQSAPFATPLVRDTRAQVGEAVYAALIEQDRLIQLNEDVFFLRETYDEMVQRVTEALAGGGRLTVAQVRDMFQASRKYALALMEHLDARGVTVRVGDDRVLKRK
jgi:selenocysteine-specific elongation factor